MLNHHSLSLRGGLTGVSWFLLCGCLAAVLTPYQATQAESIKLIAVSSFCDDGLTCTASDGWEGGVCAGTLRGNVEIHVELSPSMVPGPVERCILFKFFENCATEAVECSATIQFGDPLAPGLGRATLDVGMECPIERVFAVTAIDPLHSLRSTGELACNGTNLLAVFEGTPAEGGNWLISGNLDAWDHRTSYANANAINIIDFGLFYSQFIVGATFPDGNTTCATPGPHADINGDGIVDALDFTFILANFSAVSNDIGCSSSTATALPTPLREIAVEELYDRGLDDLAVADLNRDGWLDVDDLTEFVRSTRPTGPDSQSVRRQLSEGR